MGKMRWALVIAGWLLLVALVRCDAQARDCESCLRDRITGAITRDARAVREFKRAVPCPVVGGCKGYVVDHIVPLACADDIAALTGRKTRDVQRELDAPANMQWQDRAAAKRKDRWERKHCEALWRNPKFAPPPDNSEKMGGRNVK